MIHAIAILSTQFRFTARRCGCCCFFLSTIRENTYYLHYSALLWTTTTSTDYSKSIVYAHLCITADGWRPLPITSVRTDVVRSNFPLLANKFVCYLFDIDTCVRFHFSLLPHALHFSEAFLPPIACCYQTFSMRTTRTFDRNSPSDRPTKIYL